MIKRVSGQHQGRCPAVIHNGLVYAVATDTSGASTIEQQTRQTLETIDSLLVDAGSGKAGLVQATVYLRDMGDKPAMDAVWCDWIGGAENWPQRACVGADLAGDDMIEVVVTAAVLSPHDTSPH
jgi:enamine deaminase RidA (YjgF/YER057c/UK114 family)